MIISYWNIFNHNSCSTISFDVIKINDVTFISFHFTPDLPIWWVILFIKLFWSIAVRSRSQAWWSSIKVIWGISFFSNDSNTSWSDMLVDFENSLWFFLIFERLASLFIHSLLIWIIDINFYIVVLHENYLLIKIVLNRGIFYSFFTGQLHAFW